MTFPAIISLFVVLSLLVRALAESSGSSCSPAPWNNLGAPSFDESELRKYGSNTGLYSAATWPMPKHFFRTDWDPALVKYDDSQLTITVEKRGDGRLMGGEIRTNGHHYGYGCLSACMKPIKESGIISSLFMYTGKWDGVGGTEAPHNEIDIEFEGKNTRMMQFNYFTNNTNFNQSNEIHYPLSFDASESFNVYGFRWGPMGIEWEVNGRIVKCVGRDAAVPPPTATHGTLQKVMANAWVVSPNIQWWFGGWFNYNSFTRKMASYKWIRYEKLDEHGNCDIAPSC